MKSKKNELKKIKHFFQVKLTFVFTEMIRPLS